jgi:4-hydroxybenzoate polyprenyltransferase
METANIRSPELTLESPFVVRLTAWAKDRFPAVNVLTGFILYFMAAIVARATASGSARIPAHAGDILGAIALTAHFLLLRVLDEHKDYENDCVNHPGRALQRGLIALADLRKIGTASAAFGLGLSIAVDRGLGQATFAWVMLAGWTYLMAREFFARDWLRNHLLTYAFSHMLITPFAMIWVLRLAAPGVAIGPAFALLLALTFTSGLAFELARKSRGKEEERPSLDSYSRVLGAPLCGYALVGLCFAVLCNEFALLAAVCPQIPSLASGFVSATFLLAAATAADYSRFPTTRGRKMNEALIGLFLLANYVSVLLCPLLLRGGRWI